MKINTIILSIGIFLAVLLLVFAGFFFYVNTMFSGFETHDLKDDLINNYTQNTKEIEEVKRYAESIMHPNYSVEIEFDGDDQLEIFHVSKNVAQDSNWNLNIDDLKTDTLLHRLAWTRETLETLKEKLDAANCISVSNGTPFTIGFKRSGMGMYFYNLFDKPLTLAQKKEYKESCTHIVYNDKMVLEYGGGAVGPQCFADTARIKNP